MTASPCGVIRSIFSACTGRCIPATAGRRPLTLSFSSDADSCGLSRVQGHYNSAGLLVGISFPALTEHTDGGAAKHC